MLTKTRTWIVHKDRYGNDLPPVQYGSDLRENYRKQIWKRNRRRGGPKPRKMEGFPVEIYAREIGWALGGLLFAIGLLYYVAPAVLRFLGWL